MLDLSQEIIDKLEEPLDPSLVATRKGRGGKTLSYLEGYVVIEQRQPRYSGMATGTWGYRVVETEENKFGCKATVEFYLHGKLVSRDVGYNDFAFSNDRPGEMDAAIYDTAYKGAVTDGMKRAMRIMGAQFGNSLYGGESAPPPAQAAAPAMPKPFAGKPDTPAPQSGTVCACGKNKRAQYDVCFECNQKRKATQYEPTQPSQTQETRQPPPPPDYDPQDQTGGW